MPPGVAREPGDGDPARVASSPILIVDDDPAFRAHVAELLGGAGFATVDAPSSEDALDAARTTRPALVLLDVCLPGVSGYEVCRELRDEFGEDLPIMFVSGTRNDALDRAVGFLVGGDEFIAKPVDPGELLARARRLIARSSAARSGPPAVRPEPERLGGAGLTAREQEILRRLAEGLRPAQIATELVLSPKTVANHVQNILAKLDVHSQAQAVALAYNTGLIDEARSHENEREALVKV